MTRPLAALTLAVLMVAASGPTLAAQPTERTGRISHVGAGFGRDYLALPCRTPDNVHCGLVVRLCAVTCRVMRQTDFGPSQEAHPNRIADVAPETFRELCGESPSVGTCPGHWEVVDERLPETDTVPSR